MQLSADTLAALQLEIHRLCGVHLGPEKGYLVRQRLEPVARARGCTGFDELHRMLVERRDPTLRDAVVAAMTTNETSFFRDGHPFATFRDRLLPDLVARVLARKRAGRAGEEARARLFSAGASTGQEPYSVAMLVREHWEAHPSVEWSPGDFAITAVDISPRALAKAMSGLYSDAEIIRGVSPDRVARHFVSAADGQWQVRESLMRMISFRRVNLAERFVPLGPFEVVFCRNVLIYFDEPCRRRILGQFHRMLPPEGVLVLGASENLLHHGDLFRTGIHEGTILHHPVAQPSAVPTLRAAR